ncbi:hypothetical protein J3R83DRAFT_11978 [Lanmaoa asiatica]|nr:hypothetical protein J3R83DRAFT_11978 [Lanmaoa asiatica]
MLLLNGVSAWIEVDGKELEQYGVQEDLDQSRVTCWIPTQADKVFSVVFRDDATDRQYSLASSLQLDGSSVSGKCLYPPARTGDFPNSVTNRTVVQTDQVLSATSSRPFMFSKLELTADEDEYLNQASTRLGEIRICIYRVQSLESVLFQPGSSVPGHGKVHEGSKKAVTHCVSYGQEVKTATRYSCRVRYLDGSTPLATFIFNYRDFGLLQANGIIPKPPPAMRRKATVSEEILDLTTGADVKSEPIGEEIEIVDDATQRTTSVFLSKRSNPGRGSRERPAKRIKQEKKFVPVGEVIDLT